MGKWPAKALALLVRGYAYLISPLGPPTCRFYPTCSSYAVKSLERHGAFKGLALTLRRLLRCHPWHKGQMLDPVPASIDWPTLIGYKSREPEHGPDCGCGH